MKSDDITKALYHKLSQKNHKYICPNKHLEDWFECDMISITNSDYLHEYEIKISRSDFKADFKKIAKHEKLKGSDAVLIEHDDWKNNRKTRNATRSLNGYQYTKVVKDDKTYWEYKLSGLITPAYFWYVTPVDMLKEDEIPDYAGWLEVRENGYVVERKGAKRLHNIKVNDASKVKILESMVIRYWRLKLGLK